jgi:hypothetical protein
LTDYRYIFGTLRSERILAEIPLFGTYMDNELGVGGRFDGSFKLDQTGYDNTTLLDATEPGRTQVIVERNGKPIWAGFVWSRVYQSQSKNVQLFAQSFEKYPDYQLVRSNFTRSNVEQLDIFHLLWDHMQAVAGRDMNIVTEGLTSHPIIVPKTIDVLATDFKYYTEVLSSIADATDGFDWTIDIQRDGIGYRKVLRAGYPTIGTLDPANLIFEYPGAILNYYCTESMTSAGTHVFTLGSGEGSTMVYKETAQDLMVSQGFPRWDYTVSRKDVEKQALIDTMGEQEKVARRPPMFVVKPTIKADRTAPQFGSFGLGDACRVVIRDSRFPQGFNFDTRIIKWTLSPQKSENTDEYTLLFAGDEEG